MPDSFNRVKKIDYKTQLNNKQKEQHLFQKCSAILADYGYTTIKLSDDMHGADFIAISQVNKKSGEFYKVQLKSRFTIAKIYEEKDIYIAFPVDRDSGQWCIFPHDKLISELDRDGGILNSRSWRERGKYSNDKVGNEVEPLLEKYLIS